MSWNLKKLPPIYGGLKNCSEVNTGTIPTSGSIVIGNLVFLSSSAINNSNTNESCSLTIEKQVIATLQNLKQGLKSAGSSLENLVKYYIFLKNASDASMVWKTMLKYFEREAPALLKEPPAIAVSEVIGFEKPACLIEMDAIAVVSGNKPGWEVKKYPMSYGGVNQTYPYIQPGNPFFSESVVVGNLVFLSAMDAVDPETGKIETNLFEEQMDVAFEKIRSALDNCGSSVSNIIKTLHFQTGIDNLLSKSLDAKQSFSPASDRLWKRELEHYDQYAPILFDLPPASTFLKVSALAEPKAQVQLDVLAVINREQPGWEVKNYLLYLGKRGFPRHIGEIKKYYSNSVVVGNLAFISGQTPVDLFTARIETNVFEEQCKVALHNLKIALEEVGSSLEYLAKTTVLLPRPENLLIFRQIELEYFRQNAPQLLKEPPASLVIHPLNLAGTNLNIEIEAIAFVPGSQK